MVFFKGERGPKRGRMHFSTKEQNEGECISKAPIKVHSKSIPKKTKHQKTKKQKPPIPSQNQPQIKETGPTNPKQQVVLIIANKIANIKNHSQLSYGLTINWVMVDLHMHSVFRPFQKDPQKSPFQINYKFRYDMTINWGYGRFTYARSIPK